MAFPWADNLHSTAFTPRDFQVELLAAAEERNVIICLGHNSSREFIALKLILERSYELRRSNAEKKVSIYISSEASNGTSMYDLIFHLTDLKVVNLNAINRHDIDWEQTLAKFQVLILNVELFLDALVFSYVDVSQVNLVVIEECHKRYGDEDITKIFDFIHISKAPPKVLGLAGPLHSAGCVPSQLAFHLNYLEKAIDCRAETASDIVTVLRYCSKPIEIVLQCGPPNETELSIYLRDLIAINKTFLNDHRFDPSEIYSDDLLEELQKIPSPQKEPLEFLDQFLNILDEFGPWAADRAALTLLMQIEKAKVKTPYERNFLLFCMVSTTFIQIRAHCEYVFQSLPTEKERIETYSSPKVLRLLEVLRLFAPQKKSETAPTDKTDATHRLSELSSLDFNKLSTNVDSACDRIEKPGANEATVLKRNLLGMLKDERSNGPEALEASKSSLPSSNKSPHFRNFRNRRPITQRTLRAFPNNHQNDPDALCGIIFCNSNVIAKVLFALVYEISKNDPELDYLMVQFTMDRTADPLTETKQAENEHRKQEEVLKRFRMHLCNLLIGTAVLEEGIELPKCNLVIRWDAPTTYRSYVQCKGRARAHHAYHVIMVAPTKDRASDVHEEGPHWLPDRSHALICPPNQRLVEAVTANSEWDEDSSSDSDDADGIVSTKALLEEIQPESVYENGDECVTNQNGYRKHKSRQNIRHLFENYTCMVDKDVTRKEIDEILGWNSGPKQHSAIDNVTEEIVSRLAQYREIEKMLLSKCNNKEPLEAEILAAEKFTSCLKPYQPLGGDPDKPSVNLSTAILLVNKYCAKLPSDTFTKLTALWRCARTQRNGIDFYQYTIRLPINSPLKRDILGLPMPSRTLARRMAALTACKILHQSGELDDYLQPIGKEGFRASEPDWENFELEKADEEIVNENLEPRPGTTRRRQYYYKKIASAFCNCRPIVGAQVYLYHIRMTLECPIPEEQNTRGRKIYPPEDSPQGFGILTMKHIPKLSAFSIFTRSGEVKVSLKLAKSNIILDESQLEQINVFLKYTFANVLRLQKYLMLFDPEANDNSFLVVPTIHDASNAMDVDWNFLQVIADNCDVLPTNVPDDVRAAQPFDPNRFRDAVVMPWYRNQDQPQYFYVAEICDYLSPESSFPGDNYTTFREYYFRKYDISIQNCEQPLLDVDHTSARLNFLTPRYVNRKGVALPTSSEETKRAKRENLEQKQILVPELCTIHPFPASLWRAAVCLPCILYRLNALLLADEIRKQVAHDIGLGVDCIDHTDVEWSPLDFGWSLADVLERAKENIQLAENQADESVVPTSKEEDGTAKESKEDAEAKDENANQEGADIHGEKTANDILAEAERILKESQMEIGTWSNEMAENIDMDDSLSDDEWGILPPNINICSRDKTLVRYGSPTSWDVGANKNAAASYYSDSDDTYRSDDDVDLQDTSNLEDGQSTIKIEFKSDNVAEAIDTEEDIQKRQRQLEIINNINANEKYYQKTKNIGSGYDCDISIANESAVNEMKCYENTFSESIHIFQSDIKTSGALVKYNEKLMMVKKKRILATQMNEVHLDAIHQMVPFITKSVLEEFVTKKGCINDHGHIQMSLNDFYEIHRLYFEEHENIEKFFIEGSGSIFDKFNDSTNISKENGEYVLSMRAEDLFCDRVLMRQKITDGTEICAVDVLSEDGFSFDRQPALIDHPGPSPSIILQGLTMSNANDGINLERLETIGDSFLKYAITTYLYCTYENVHEGKLSHLRSRQVSNLNLYRLGRRKILGEFMIATKFEPHDNWLPPCYYVPKDLEKALIEARIPTFYWNIATLPNVKNLSVTEICRLLKEKAFGFDEDENDDDASDGNVGKPPADTDDPDIFPCFIPYNLVTQHSIPDKSIADCVEALIGAYLIDCGPRGALLFMAWLGIRVLPCKEITYDESLPKRITGSTKPYERDGAMFQTIYGYWAAPKSPLLDYAPNPYETLELLLDGYSDFEAHIGYQFRDRSYLLQAMTHASYSPNRLTDCYQRLEFLGDAVLDYLITRHLYEDPRQHSPGALTDLRSALVNNTIFASLAVRHGFHKYFKHLSPGLNDVIDRFVRIQHENGHSISEEFYLISEEECDEAEDVEVPKALGDVFESVAGAIFLDSNMSLDTVWKVYSNMMRPEIEQFSNSVPKSPIRELLELEPETAKFSKPEKLADGRRVRVTVEVFGKGTYRGIGRNYRIAKCTAAKCALRQLKKQGLINRKH